MCLSPIFQAKEKKYIMFKTSSKSTYEYEIGNGKKGVRKTYVKEYKNDGNIDFYIKDKVFKFNLKTSEADTCNIKYLNNIDLSDIKTLENEVNKVNPYYPFKVFPNLFLVEKINDSTIVKYKVKWEYYIE